MNDVKLFVECPNLACKNVCALIDPMQEMSDRDDSVRYCGTIEQHIESSRKGEYVHGIVERADGTRVGMDAFVIEPCVTKPCDRSGDVVAIFVKLR